MRVRSAAVCLCAGVAMLWGGAGEAVADGTWSVPRGDALRSGRATRPGNLSAPQVLRSHYLGGFVRGTEALAADVLGDGSRELLTLVGGKLLVSNASGAVLADARPLGLEEIWGVYDMNGDGSPEVLGVARSFLVLIDPATGDVMWSQRSNGNWEFVVVRDVDGDPEPELVALEFNGATCAGRDLWRFDFDAESLGAPTATQLRTNNGCAGQPFLVGDFNNSGDGQVEIAMHGRGALSAYDIVTGDQQARATMYSTSVGSHRGRLWGRDVDGDGGLELVHVSGGGYDQVIYVARLGDGAWEQLWVREVERSSSNTSNINVRSVARSVADLNGDGAHEIVLSLFNDDGAGTWRLEVIDGASGATLASGADLILEDVLDLDGDAQTQEIVALRAPGAEYAGRRYGTLEGLRWSGDGFETLWALEGVGAHRVEVRSDPLTGPMTMEGVAHQDLDGDGALDMYVNQDTNSDGLADVLEVWSVAGEAPRVLARYETDKVLTEVLVLGVGDALSAATGQRETWISQSDGFLSVLDDGLVTLQQVRGGGHRTDGLVAGAMGNPDGTRSVVVPNSRGQIEVLDLSAQGDINLRTSLSTTVPARPSILPLGGELRGPSVVVPTFVDDQITLTLHDRFGAAIWSVPMGYGRPDDDATFRVADLNGAGELDIVTVLFNPETEKQEVTALDGDNGALLWRFWQYPDDFPSPRDTVILDVNGDGVDDVVYNSGRNTMTLIDGVDGSVIRSASRAFERSVLVGELDGDAGLEVIRGPGPHGWSVHDLASGQFAWEYRTPIQYECDGFDLALWDIDLEAGGLDIVSGSRFGQVRALLGASGELVWSRYLSGGVALDEDPGDAAALNSPVVADIDGDGLDEAIFTAADGFVYAITRSGAVLWALDLGFAAGQPIVADLNDDGLSEVVVSAADGYVHVVGQPVLEAAGAVLDVALSPDGEVIDPSVDVDEVDRLTEVGVALVDPPAEATSFQARVLTEGGTPLTDWIWSTLPSGAVPARLLPGNRYLVEARPIDAETNFGAVVRSDGFEANDALLPVVVSLTANPERLPNPAVTQFQASIIGVATDRGALERLTLELTAEGDPERLIRRWTVRPDNVNEGDIRVAWDGTDTEGVPVVPGAYRVELIAQDRAQLEARASLTLEVLDDGAPVAPTIQSPEDRAILATTTPLVEGVAPEGAQVEVRDVRGVVCAAEVVDTAWSCTPEPPLEEGTAVLWAVAVGASGLESVPSPSITVRIAPDEEPPDAGMDVAEDVAEDVAPDVAEDIAPDVAEDTAEPDVAPDVAEEDTATPDAPEADAGGEAGGEAQPEEACGCSAPARPVTPSLPVAFMAALALGWAAARRRRRGA